MTATFTSGAARQHALRPIQAEVAVWEPSEPGWPELAAAIKGVNHVHDTAGLENPILVVFRWYGFGGDPELGAMVGRFLDALAGRDIIWSGWDITDDLTRTIDEYQRRQNATTDTVTAWKAHALAVLTRLRVTATAA